MANERVIEIPWMLAQVPQSGTILDIGCCEATYLHALVQPSRIIHALDPRDCSCEMPSGVIFHHENLIGNMLPRVLFDAVIVLSTLEHIGLPYYQQNILAHGDSLALAEIRELIKPSGFAIFTVPVGCSKVTLWYRQYTPRDLSKLFAQWQVEISYWGYKGKEYVRIEESEVEMYDYDYSHGAGAIAGIIAKPCN